MHTKDSISCIVVYVSLFQFESADDGIIGLAQFGNKVGMRISFAKDSLAILKGNCIEKNLPLIQGDEKAV